MLSTKLVVDHEAVPADIWVPVQLRAEVGGTVVSKFTPATVMVLMVWVVAMVNVTVAVTPAAPATLLDSTMEGAVSAAVKTAGNATFATVSMPTAAAVQVETVTPVVAAAAAAAFLSPANWQTT